MTKYIEFVGVPGIGKTSTYKYLRNRLNGKLGCIHYEDLCKEPIRSKKLKDLVKWYLKSMVKPDLLPTVKHDRHVLNRAIQSHRELVDMFWDRMSEASNSDGKELRFYGVKYIRDILEKIQNIKDRQEDLYCLVDEGIIHNLRYFIPVDTNQKMAASVHEVLNLIELPTAVVYFEGDIELNLKRIFERGNLRLRDRHLSLTELKKSRLAAMKEKDFLIEMVQKRNIPVLKLDASDSVEVKAEMILKFVGSLNNKPASAFLSVQPL